MKPLAIDLFAGLGGWTEGLLGEGYDSSARQAASARIAKIPCPLARHIARVYKPVDYT